MTIRPATKATKAKPRTGVTKVLDTIAPKKMSASGAVRIWGMPPAVAYTLIAIAVAGGGYLVFRQLGGGGRRVATNPRRRGSARGRKSRRKR